MKPLLRPAGQRRAGDAYYTPPQLARFICLRLVDFLPEPRTIVEPHSGGGAFVAAARTFWPDSEILAFDIDPGGAGAALKSGANVFEAEDWVSRESSLRYRSTRTWDLIIGNPPFRGAEDHIKAALERLAPGGHLAFLLRLSILGGQERARTLWAKPGLRYLLPITPRPSFDGKGTDASEYGVLVWRKDFIGRATVLPPLQWKEG